MSRFQLFEGDCMKWLPTLEAGSVDAIIADLPYGTTACEWDSVIPLDELWPQFKRLIRPSGAVVLFGSQPFTSELVISNLDWFKYSLVWEKTIAANFMNAKNKYLQSHEDIAIFSPGTTANGSDKRMVYNPQGLKRTNHVWKRPQKYPTEHKFTRESHKLERVIEFSCYPRSVLKHPNGNNDNVHPTQKPLSLLIELIRTYTNPGDLVLDPTMGSGTCGVAALQNDRRFVGMELKEDYFAIAHKRITDASRAADGLPKQLTGHADDWAASPLFAEVA